MCRCSGQCAKHCESQSPIVWLMRIKHAHPTMRYGQILHSAMEMTTYGSIYYVPDDVLAKALAMYYEKVM